MASSTNNLPDTKNNDPKDQWIKEIMSLTEQLAKQWEAEDDEERQWMRNHCHNPEIADILNDVTVKMLHVLDAIGQHEPVNGITISKKMSIPKGSVSKITRRLVEKNLVQTTSLPNNKKEVLFYTTSLGKELFQVHRNLHQEINKGVNQFLKKYNDRELRFLARVLRDTSETSWVNLGNETE